MDHTAHGDAAYSSHRGGCGSSGRENGVGRARRLPLLPQLKGIRSPLGVQVLLDRGVRIPVNTLQPGSIVVCCQSMIQEIAPESGEMKMLFGFKSE